MIYPVISWRFKTNYEFQLLLSKENPVI